MYSFLYILIYSYNCQHKNEYRRSIDDYQPAAPVRRKIGLYWILAMLRIALTFAPQTGYIHPDEFFQSIEVISGMSLFYRVPMLVFQHIFISFKQEITSTLMFISRGNSIPRFLYAPHSFLSSWLVCLMQFSRDCLRIRFISLDCH